MKFQRFDWIRIEILDEAPVTESQVNYIITSWRKLLEAAC